MAATVKALFGTSNQAFTITLTSRTNTACQESTVIDNSTSLYLDALVMVKVKANASGTGSNGVVNVYAYGTADGGTTYSGSATGSNAAYTPTVPTQLRLIGTINVVANGVTYNGGPFSVANAFGGVLPEKWGIVVENLSGATLDASVGNAWYQGVYQQVA